MIQSIAGNTITLQEPVATTKPIRSFVGKKLFGGTIVSITERERSKTKNYEQQVSCNDYSELFDRKSIVETYNDMFFREILGRIVYEFVANDEEKIIDGFESAWMNSGTGAVMTDDTDDRIS